MFANIPAELREIDQWICWRLVERDGAKPTKVPLNARTGQLASVTKAADYSSFAEAVFAAPNCNGIGFVFTRNDPFTGIDLDDTHGDTEAFARQLKIFESFNSYSELSPSGRGLHIIVKAKLPGRGRRRSSVELYDNERFFTFTGNVHRNAPIADRQELTEILYNEMGGPAETFALGIDQPEKETDASIIARAAAALNGEKFSALFAGDWGSFDYPSQSEADFALVDIIAHYTKNRMQIARIFRNSILGQTPKDNYKHRGDRLQYVSYMVEKSFDRQLPPIDIDGLNVAFEKMMQARMVGPADKSSEKAAGPVNVQPEKELTGATDGPALKRSPRDATFPRGLVGEIAQFIFDAAPRPVREIALAGAIGFMAGVTGRAFNIGGSGLNQYIILIADTGRGKEAIASGISKLQKAVAKTVPQILKFEGPAQIASSQGLSKWLSREPCVYSIVGEFGIKLRQLADERAAPHLAMLKADLLALFHKGGHGDAWGATAYAKREDTTSVINSPSFTLIGESTPLRFFENVSEDVVTDGLLPRFTIFTYEGDQVELNPQRQNAEPSIALIEKVGSLVAQATSISARDAVQTVSLTPEAAQILNQFEKFTRDSVNNRDPETGLKLPTRVNAVVTELWNRAHTKASRLAAVLAVGCNYIDPRVEADQAAWATNEIYWQTRALLDRFKRGDIGGGAVNAVANEDKQTEIMCHRIFKLASGKATTGQYNINEKMVQDKIIPFNLLLQTLRIYPAFKNDRRGASEAIRKIYQQLLDNDDLREVPKAQMQEKYGKSCRAFAISNAERFYEAA
jgi:hypothetical protein